MYQEKLPYTRLLMIESQQNLYGLTGTRAILRSHVYHVLVVQKVDELWQLWPLKQDLFGKEIIELVDGKSFGINQAKVISLQSQLSILRKERTLQL